MTRPADILAGLDAAATKHRTPCGDGTMVWRIWGDPADGTRPPLVLLHGAFGTWAHFARNVERMAQRFTVVAPDMPNHGDSDMLPEGSLAPEFGTAVAAGLEAIFPTETRFHVVGFSLGGIIGAWTGVALGQRLASFVVCCTGALEGPYKRVEGLRRWHRDMPVAEMDAVHRHNLGILMFADPARVDDLAVHIQRTNALRTRVRGPDIVPPGSILEALSRIEAPVDGIWGGCDVYARDALDERAAIIRRVQPRFNMCVVPDAGHWVMYEQADAFEATLAALLDTQAA